MTDKERLVARLNERIAIHEKAADGYRSIDAPIKAAVAQAWAEAAQACLDDVESYLADDPELELDRLIGAYVP